MSAHHQILRRCVDCQKSFWPEKGRDIDCPECGEPFDRTPPPDVAFGVRPDFKPWLSENLDHLPVLVKSRRHWAEEMKKRGLCNRDYGINCPR